jgi:peptide/nickel transport system substrate-binding protein
MNRHRYITHCLGPRVGRRSPWRFVVDRAFVGLLLLVASGALAADPPEIELRSTQRPPGSSGGQLVVALRAQPLTLNPLHSVDNPSRTVLGTLMAGLVQTNRETQEIEPAVAKSWTSSQDGRRFTIELRRGLRFSDGEPVDADDVVFTFKLYLDEKAGSNSYRQLLIVDGEPIGVKKLGSHTLELELARANPEGVRAFEEIAILPEHLLAKPYGEGSLAQAWSLDTPAAAIAGLGPFRVKRSVVGERLELERNPHYWKVDTAGTRLPYLDRLTFVFVASEDAQLLRFRSGETHVIDHLSAESFNLLAREAPSTYALRDLAAGPRYEFLFFNLNDVEADLPMARRQKWFKNPLFRRAVSMAIDRDGIVRLVYQRRATPIASHITPNDTRWYNELIKPPRRSLASSRKLLAGAGFTWDAQKRLHDGEGQRVAFTLVTNSSNQKRIGMATILQEDLRQLGIEVKFVPLEFRALIERLTSTSDYEACLLGLTGGTDPNDFLNVWHSDGDNHLWRMGGEISSPWQEELNRLMVAQGVELEQEVRKSLYDRVQAILAEEEPYILLVSPNILVAAHRDLGNFAPTIRDHATLWNVEELYWRGASSSGRP